MGFSQFQTVFVLCTLALTSATNPNSDRKGPSRGSPSSRPGDTCHNQLINCYRDRFEKYDKYNINRTLAAIHQAGFTQVCHDVGAAVSCAKQAFLLQDCENLPEYLIKHARAFVNVGEYVCEERQDDASQHFDCLLNPEVFARISRCMYYTKTNGPCDIEPIIECTSSVVRHSTPECQPGADDLTQEVLTQLKTIGPCGSS